MATLFRILFAALGLSFPFLNVGIALGDYPLPLPMIVLLLIDIAAVATVLVRGPRSLPGQATLAACFFVVFAATVTYDRVAPKDYLLSLSALACLWIPFLVRIPVTGVRQHAQKWFLRGQYLNWGICLYALFSQVLGLRPMDQIVPVIVPQRTDPLAVGLYRLNGLMVEPSFLGMYLAFGYIVNDLTIKDTAKREVSRLVFILSILLTGSLSAIALWGFYMGVRVLHSGRLRPQHLLVKKSTLISLLTLLIVVLLALASASLTRWGREGLGNLAGYIGFRLDRVSTYWASGDFLSSEGVRLSAIPIAFQYLREGQLLGEGYGAASKWLAENTWLENGNIHNVFTYLLVSLGLPGLILFLLFTSILSRRVDKECKSVIPAWYLLGFLTGHLIFYYYWGYLLLFAVNGRQPPVPEGQVTR